MTIIIVIGFLLTSIAFGAWQLYGLQNTSQLIHRVTEVVPVPIAKVDGTMVRYSDYLLELRSALHYLSTKEAVNFSSDDGKRQLNYQKRLALNKAIEGAYIGVLAQQQNINVSDKEVDEFIKKEIQSNSLGANQDIYEQVIRDYYDWTFDDYKKSVKKQLLRKKVIAKVDVGGRKKIQSLQKSAQSGADFADLAKQSSDDPMAKATGGDIGFVGDNANDPSGLIPVARQLAVGQVSEVIEGVDGFYIIKLLERRNSDVRFAKIYVSYKSFNLKMANLKKDNKIEEYINVPETVTSTSR